MLSTCNILLSKGGCFVLSFIRTQSVVKTRFWVLKFTLLVLKSIFQSKLSSFSGGHTSIAHVIIKHSNTKLSYSGWTFINRCTIALIFSRDSLSHKVSIWVTVRKSVTKTVLPSYKCNHSLHLQSDHCVSSLPTPL